MDEQVNNDELLMRYLDGELTASEKIAVETRLRTDSSLQDELTRLRVAVQAVRHLGTTQYVQSLHSEMMQELKARPKAKVISMPKAVRYGLSVAASILILLVGVRLFQASQISSDKLYNEAFVDFNTSASRSAGGGLSTIEQHYQQKAYETVIADPRSALLQAKDSLLIGLSYLHTARYNQAIGFFQNLAATANDYRQDAEFYLSLSHLKNKEYSKALPLLQKIATDKTHLYHERIDEDFLAKVKKLSEKN